MGVSKVTSGLLLICDPVLLIDGLPGGSYKKFIESCTEKGLFEKDKISLFNGNGLVIAREEIHYKAVMFYEPLSSYPYQMKISKGY